MKRLIALFAVTFAAASLSQAEEKLVWQLGEFNHSSAEFRGRPNVRQAVDANAPDAASKWPATQMGTQNRRTAGQPPTRTLRFSLPAERHGTYSLDVSVLLAHPRGPHLQFKLNGTTGLIYLNRKLSYVSDWRMHSPAGGEAREVIPIPASLLKAGINDLEITAVDDAPDENGDSIIAWDALRMLNDPNGSSARESEIAVEPTVFYTGKNEIVNVTVTLPEVVTRGELKLELGGAEFRKQLTPSQFGRQRFELPVPEFAADSTAKVSLSLNGRDSQRTLRVSPKRKFTVYLVPHMHLDIGFTDYQPKVLEVQNLSIDRLLADMRREPDMRFSLDGSMVAEEYLRSRSSKARQDFLTQVKAGKITIPAQYAILMNAASGLETLIRSTTLGYALNKQAGIRVEYANSTDTPGFPWSYASILRGAGLKYFAAAGNSDRGGQAIYGRWHTRSPFWWEGPDGGKVLMAYTWQYAHLWWVGGLPPREAGFRASLPTFLEPYEEPSYKLDTVLMYGSQAENTYLVPGEAEFVREWNGRYSWPKLKLATFPEYFHHIEEKYGTKLETVKGDWGSYWEDGVGTDARYGALQRQTEGRALTVEKLSSVASLLASEWAAPVERLRRMWTAILFYAEHTYTSFGGYSRPDSEQSVRQLDTKHRSVDQAREDAHWIAQQAFGRLLDRIHVAAPAVVVFNPLAHERSDLVEMDLLDGMQIVELPGNRVVPFETLRTGDRYRRVRFFAAKTPSMGFRVYEIRRGTAADTQDIPATDTIENAYYRVRIKPGGGGIASIFDKELSRELVDTASPYLANQFLYVSGGEDSSIVYMRGKPPAKLSVSAASGAKAARLRKMEWGQVLTYTTSTKQAPSIETDIMLFDGEKKIQIVNRIRKEPSDDKEAVYFAFPFAITKPEFSYEGQVGIVNPARDELKGGCREWYAVRHWARVQGGGAGAALIPLDSPLVTFGDINRGLWPQKFEPKSGTIFSYPLNNYWHTNFPRVQGGEFTFRYLLTSGSQLNENTLSRMGRDAMMPLEAGELTRFDKAENPDRPLPPVPTSFLNVDGDHVELETFKPAEDGNGYVLRLLETAGRQSTVRIGSPLLRFDGAWLCNAAEEDERKLDTQKNTIETSLRPFSVVTVRARMSFMGQ